MTTIEEYVWKIASLVRMVMDMEDDGERKIFVRMLDKNLMESAFKIVSSVERRLFFYGSKRVQTLLRTFPSITAPAYYGHGLAYRNEDKMKDLMHRTQCLIDPSKFTHPRLPPHKEYLMTL